MKPMEKLYPYIEGYKNRYGYSKLVYIPTDTVPPDPVQGTTYADLSENAIKYFDGSNWLTFAAPAVAYANSGTDVDLSTTPTATEISSVLGAGNKSVKGFLGVIVDTSDGKTYLVASDGANWQYVALTKAN